ncbi:MAG: hypothetical protein LH615_07885 [Ferruginibacter sp.]|nr:hypothetical protein [Ferruginibacter sp.]
MTSLITIETEKHNHGGWLKIYIPYHTTEKTIAIIQNTHGEVIKLIKLNEGTNSIDISNIFEEVVDVKIETAYEIILRKINLTNYEKY